VSAGGHVVGWMRKMEILLEDMLDRVHTARVEVDREGIRGCTIGREGITDLTLSFPPLVLRLSAAEAVNLMYYLHPHRRLDTR
jgi:hypothetical protein